MVKPEFTGKRDLTYSRWHRTIGDDFYMIDLDCVEWRANRGVVALIEIARFNPNNGVKICEVLERKKTELTILTELKTKLHVPAYLVLYTPSLTTFWIFEVEKCKAIFSKAVSNLDYTHFIRGL